jgi:hypothetical protein
MRLAASDIAPVPEENHTWDGECFDVLACLPDPIWLVSAASILSSRCRTARASEMGR